jgi:probable HAF family extracellular repeat protein
MVLGLVLASSAHAGYNVVDLGGLPGGSAALGIAADGTIGGWQLTGPFQPHATRFTPSGPVDLGTLGGDASLALGVGSGGKVVGWARLDESIRHAFLEQDGVMRDLGTLGGDVSQAFGVNASGTVVGSSYVADMSREVPFIWTNGGGMKAIPVPEVNGGQALSINNGGDVVGYYIDSIFVQPFQYSHGVAQTLPTLGGFASKAYGISANGTIVGYAITPDFDTPKFHAVVWRHGQITDLGAMAGGHGTAYGVNNSGTIVGFSYDADFNQIAVLWRTEGNIDLNTLLPADTPWKLNVATGVADNGTIVGIGTLNGMTRAFELQPQGPPVRRGVSAEAVSSAPPSHPRPGTVDLTLDRSMTGPLRLYDITGRRVAELARGPFGPGRLTMSLTSDVTGHLRSGVYFVRLEDAGTPLQQKVVVIK